VTGKTIWHVKKSVAANSGAANGGGGHRGPGPPPSEFLQTIKPVHCNYREGEEFNRG